MERLFGPEKHFDGVEKRAKYSLTQVLEVGSDNCG